MRDCQNFIIFLRKTQFKKRFMIYCICGIIYSSILIFFRNVSSCLLCDVFGRYLHRKNVLDLVSHYMHVTDY